MRSTPIGPFSSWKDGEQAGANEPPCNPEALEGEGNDYTKKQVQTAEARALMDRAFEGPDDHRRVRLAKRGNGGT
jgi:hypothetical protein